MIWLRMRIPVSSKIPHTICLGIKSIRHSIALATMSRQDHSRICSETAIKRCQVFQASNSSCICCEARSDAGQGVLMNSALTTLSYHLQCICDSVEWCNLDKGIIPAVRVMLRRNVIDHVNDSCFTMCPMSLICQHEHVFIEIQHFENMLRKAEKRGKS
jgi:hypothetical protein